MNISIILASFLSGALGSMGFGGGTVLIMYLTLLAGMEQKQAQGINLIFFLPCAFLSVLFYSKKGIINIKNIFPYILWGAVGTFIGYLLLDKIPSHLLSKLFGALLILMGIKDLLIAFKKSSNRS